LQPPENCLTDLNLQVSIESMPAHLIRVLPFLLDNIISTVPVDAVKLTLSGQNAGDPQPRFKPQSLTAASAPLSTSDIDAATIFE
jgi:hypothetical protein